MTLSCTISIVVFNIESCSHITHIFVDYPKFWIMILVYEKKKNVKNIILENINISDLIYERKYIKNRLSRYILYLMLLY